MPDDSTPPDPIDVRALLHEIRGELTTIRGNAGLLRRTSDAFSLAERQSFATTVESAAVRVDELTSDVAAAVARDGRGTSPTPAPPPGRVDLVLALVEEDPRPITVVDRQLRFVYSNRVARLEARRLLGQELTPGTALSDAYAPFPDRWEEVRRHWVSALRGEDRLIVRDVPVVDDPQTTTTLEVRHRPLHVAGEIAGAVAIATDITSQRRTDDALRRAESDAAEARALTAARTMFLSRMSHELRTPLNAIAGFATLLLSQTDGLAHTHAEQVVQAARQLTALVDDVLDLALFEDQELTLSPEHVDLASAVSEAVSALGEAAPALEVHLPSGPVSVHADLQSLLQILRSLLRNVTEHGGGRAALTAAVTDDVVTLELTDDGAGIPREDADRVFEPFARLDDRVGAGAGLGLAVARGLARAVGGDLRLTRHAPAGAGFTLTLPRALDEPAPGPSPAPSGDAAGDLLYIEDNPSNVRLLESVMLLRPGIELRTATSAAAGVKLAAAHPPDLVLLDVHLPDGSGLDSIGALRAAAGTADLPIVVLTADASPATRRRARDLGSSHHLTKPFDVDELLVTVDRFMSETGHQTDGVGTAP
ncbi:ATP-binding protein [Paraconexibacter sp.]|uniref:ATP-binding protein n=1 Tax=Paraconexibacter sp. TaxID=2949640 RepID=UPI003564FEE6